MALNIQEVIDQLTATRNAATTRKATVDANIVTYQGQMETVTNKLAAAQDERADLNVVIQETAELIDILQRWL